MVAEMSASEIWEATISFAESEVARISREVCNTLQAKEKYGLFDEIKPRNLWDEYCWSLQEGPFESTEWSGGLRLGSISDGFDKLVESLVTSHCSSLTREARKIVELGLSERPVEAIAYILEPGEQEGVLPNSEEEERNLLETAVKENIDSSAASRDLSLIGPYRAEEVRMSLSWGSGWLGQILKCSGEGGELIEKHAEALLDSDPDLAGLEEEVAEVAWKALTDASVDRLVVEFLEHYEDEIRALVAAAAHGACADLHSELQWQIDES